MFSQLEQAITFDDQINRMICDFFKSWHVLLEVPFKNSCNFSRPYMY